MSEITCPRCGRKVTDVERYRQAHRLSCVRIPRHRPKGWGKKVKRG